MPDKERGSARVFGTVEVDGNQSPDGGHLEVGDSLFPKKVLGIDGEIDAVVAVVSDHHISLR
jgi:hypothetical protein